MANMFGGLVRTGLAAFGGYLVSKGLIDQSGADTLSSNASALTGVATVIGTAVWSWWSKRNAK